MDVDEDNFEEALASLEAAIPRAAFVACDLEMTGITGGPHTQPQGGDVPQVRYTKGRAVVNQPLNIVQVGICLFEEIGAGQFAVRPYNIYVFPRPVEERDANGKNIKTDPFVGLSSSSIAFLASNGLDFQRWITKGVSYTTRIVKESLLAVMPPMNGAAPTEPGNGVLKQGKVEATKPQDIEFVKETMRKVGDFAAGDDQEMKLPGTNGFLALVLRQSIAEKHPELTVEKRPSDNNPRFQDRWLVKLTDAGRQEQANATRRRLQAHIGFLSMWDVLVQSKKPVILHNGFFDLLFLFSAFEGGLPAELSAFKSRLHASLPNVFDTKVLAESRELNGRLGSRSALPELAAGLAARLAPKQPPEEAKQSSEADDVDEDEISVSFSFPAGFGAYADSNCGAFHTAGYDAYETGRIFAYYRAELESVGLKPEGFTNRIFLMGTAFELQLDDVADPMTVQGIARCLHNVDTAIINNRTLGELLKPVTDGKRRSIFRWCCKDQMLLIIEGPDTAPDEEGRSAIEEVLDGLLKNQEEQGRLDVVSLEDHISKHNCATSPVDLVETEEKPAKKRRTG